MTPRKITIHVRLNGAPGRNQLNGIFRYLGRTTVWDLRLTQGEGSLLEEIKATVDGHDHPDGFIIAAPISDEVCTLIARLRVPTVLIDIRPGRIPGKWNKLAFVHNDDGGLGLAAARHLMRLGNFRSYAFVHAKKPSSWSDRRLEAFNFELRQHGRACAAVYESNDLAPADDRRRMTDFLAGLERPTAVFAAWDGRAIQVLECAHAAKINIPDEMALLSVDDDIICEHTHPPLASIRPDNEAEGHCAAKTLDLMLRGKRWPKSSLCPIIGISERESASSIAPGGHLVRRAIDFIQANRTRPLRVTDVVRHLGVSRRLADQRFRQFQSESILECITRIRLEEVKKRLTSSDASIATIAQACGFHDTSYLMTLFQRKVGMTMRAWRRQSRIPG